MLAAHLQFNLKKITLRFEEQSDISELSEPQKLKEKDDFQILGDFEFLSKEDIKLLIDNNPPEVEENDAEPEISIKEKESQPKSKKLKGNCTKLKRTDVYFDDLPIGLLDPLAEDLNLEGLINLLDELRVREKIAKKNCDLTFYKLKTINLLRGLLKIKNDDLATLQFSICEKLLEITEEDLSLNKEGKYTGIISHLPGFLKPARINLKNIIEPFYHPIGPDELVQLCNSYILKNQTLKIEFLTNLIGGLCIKETCSDIISFQASEEVIELLRDREDLRTFVGKEDSILNSVLRLPEFIRPKLLNP